MNVEQLKWMTPVAVIVAGVAWKFARPACETFVFFLVEGNTSRHETLVRKPLEEDLARLDELCDRLSTIEGEVSANTDRLEGFESSLLAQGATLRDQITQVFDPLHRTLEKMESALERIASDTKTNSVQIGELRGLWDGAERRRPRSN